MTRPARYKENNSSRDWIDEFCATSTVDESRGAFRFTIGKYLRRYGKKDDPLQEALKIQDYANRLVEFERAARAEQDGWTTEAIKAAALPPDFGQSNTISYPATPKEGPDVSFDGDSPRRQAIDQNGNDGAAYSEIDRLRAAADFNDDVPVSIYEPKAPKRESFIMPPYEAKCEGLSFDQVADLVMCMKSQKMIQFLVTNVTTHPQDGNKATLVSVAMVIDDHIEPQRPRHVCPACGLGHSIGQCNPMTLEEAVALGGKPIAGVAE